MIVNLVLDFAAAEHPDWLCGRGDDKEEHRIWAPDRAGSWGTVSST